MDSNTGGFIDYRHQEYDPEQMKFRAREYYEWLNKRRSVREFSPRAVPRDVIEYLVMAAGTSPSGAHKQPWSFCAVSDPQLKKRIRNAAEEEEYKSYHGRMSDEWLQDLSPLGTDWEKPFLEIAPWLIIVFRRSYEVDVNGTKHQNYYVAESVGLACGMLLSAIHNAGLVALTHTPSPMNFLCEILKRPLNEKPYLLIPVGYPAENCRVPDLKRKGINEIVTWF